VSTTARFKRVVAAALMAGGVAAGMTLTPGTAHAESVRGPFTWCPGQPQYFDFSEPINWDWNVCHTYYIVLGVPGNVSKNIWEGDNPPVAPQNIHRPPRNCGLFYCEDPGT
jgi:hypothetical protein